jgi:hypothetical protein
MKIFKIMNSKYLDKMIMQPDYVVVYDENKGFYHGNTLNREDYKKLQYDMSIYDTKVKMLVGYAASKSHPNNPVKVYISLDMRDCLGNRLDHHYIRVNKVVNEQSEQYQGKHDLFIYSDFNVAVLAGKEMAFMDSIDEYIETVGSKVKEYFPDVKFNRNFDFKWLQDKFNTYKEREYFDKDISQLNDVFKKTVDNSKETVKNTVNKAKDYAKSGVERLIKELADIDIPKQKPEYAKNEEDFALYKQLTDEYAVLLKHRKRNGKSRYTVNIIKLTLDTNKTYDITFEQFYDIYEILNEGGEGCLKFNSINDVLGNQIFEEKPIEVIKEKPKKINPIQFCQFRKEDEVPSQPKPGKAKFKIGDLVYIKSMGIEGRVVDIFDIRTDAGKTRKLYKVVCGPHEYKSFYSYELEKA